jgi:pectin methylesterase-like acyl-CoA thioesterase
MLNARKQFVLSVVLTTVVVVIVGGASALASPVAKVRCVPVVAVNSGCTAATTYATIQAAVNAASSYDVIYVGPGTYHESVTISEADHARDYLSLLGAQAGNDARVGRSNPLAESIVDATGQTDSAIIVEALAVVVDGFTLQGATQGQASGA